MKTIKVGILAIVLAGCTAKENTNTMDNAIIPVNDPHSYSQPHLSKVTHLHWVAEVDFDNKVIDAQATLTLQNSIDAQELVLDTKGLTIHRITAGDSTELPFSMGVKDTHLGQPLTIQITPNITTVALTYTTSAEAEALQWLEPVQTADKQQPFLFTQSQAILARSWVPIQDSPGIRFTYNATVTVPPALMALMSAENPKKKAEDGIYHFTMDQPIPAYLLALAVGDLEFQPLGPRSGVYAEPSVIDQAVYEFIELEEMIKVAEELYGPYRWEQYDLIVLPPSFPFGGMENPRLTFATPTILAGDRSLTSLVAHELAHSWSGNLVTNATWDDFWLNEGFTVYFEMRIMEKLYGRDYSEMLAALATQDLKEEVAHMQANDMSNDTKLKLDLVGRNPDDGVTSIAYDKGYLFLRSLEEEVGRDRFDMFLKDYFNSHAFEVMTTEAFVSELENNLFIKNGLKMDKEKIQHWIYDIGLPTDAPRPVSDKFEKVDAQWKRLREGAALTSLQTADWSSHEWLHFVRSIPGEYNQEQMALIDATFSLTESGNSEVLTEWLVQSIQHGYTPAYDRLETFLIHTGRRKFLMPLYQELANTEEGLKRAHSIYEKARPNYHFVSTNSIDALLNDK